MTTTSINKNTFAVLNEICTAVSQQLATEVLLEKIVASTQAITNADGASLYIKHGEVLRFHIIRNLSLKMDINGSSSAIQSLPEIKLNPQNTQHTSISSHCVANKKTINIEDISVEKRIDIASTKAFDAKFNYQTKSILATPILNKHREVLGVMQLINAKNANQIFDQSDIEICEAMSALMSIVLSQQNSVHGTAAHE